MPLKIVLVQSRRLPMPTAEPQTCVELGFKYGNTGSKLPDKYSNFLKLSVEAEIISLSVLDKNIIFIFIFSVVVFIFIYTRILVKFRKRSGNRKFSFSFSTLEIMITFAKKNVV